MTTQVEGCVLLKDEDAGKSALLLSAGGYVATSQQVSTFFPKTSDDSLFPNIRRRKVFLDTWHSFHKDRKALRLSALVQAITN